MSRYGVLRPWTVFAAEVLRVGLRRVRTLWRQRNIRIARGARIAPDVECSGAGRIVVSEGARLNPGVVLVAEDNATIDIGPHAVIGKRSDLRAREGQQLVIGPGVRIAEDVKVWSVAGVTIGEGAVIDRYAEIFAREPQGAGSLTIGKHCRVGRYDILDLCSDVSIGDNTQMGPFCAVYTHDHGHSRGAPFWDQPIELLPVRISCDVYMGHGCVLLPGTEVGERAILAARAVVTHSVPAEKTVGGNPAREIMKTPSALHDSDTWRPSGAQNDAPREN